MTKDLAPSWVKYWPLIAVLVGYAFSGVVAYAGLNARLSVIEAEVATQAQEHAAERLELLSRLHEMDLKLDRTLDLLRQHMEDSPPRK